MWTPRRPAAAGRSYMLLIHTCTLAYTCIHLGMHMDLCGPKKTVGGGLVDQERGATRPRLNDLDARARQENARRRLESGGRWRRRQEGVGCTAGGGNGVAEGEKAEGERVVQLHQTHRGRRRGLARPLAALRPAVAVARPRVDLRVEPAQGEGEGEGEGLRQ